MQVLLSGDLFDLLNCSFVFIDLFRQSAFLALMISTIITLWLGIGFMFVPPRESRLPFSVAGCLDIVNVTALMNGTQFTTMHQLLALQLLLRIYSRLKIVPFLPRLHSKLSTKVAFRVFLDI